MTNHNHPNSKYCQWYCFKLADIKLLEVRFHNSEHTSNRMSVRWMPYCALCALYRLRSPTYFTCYKMFKRDSKLLEILGISVPYECLRDLPGYDIPEETNGSYMSHV